MASVPGYRRVEWRARHPAVDAFLDALPPKSRATAQELRGLVKANVAGVKEGIYWRTPFFFAGEPFCYLSPTQRHVIFGIIDAQGIRDKTGRLVGTGKSIIRRAKFAPGEALPAQDIASWILQAIERVRKRAPADG